MKRFWQWIRSWFQAKVVAVNEPATSETQSEEVLSGETQTDTAWTYEWKHGNGFRPSATVRDESITITLQSVTAHKIAFDVQGDLSRWAKAGVLKNNPDHAGACLVYLERGFVAKFDWATHKVRERSFENVYTQYKGMPIPNKGERVGFVLVEGSGQRQGTARCSNIIEWNWK